MEVSVLEFLHSCPVIFCYTYSEIRLPHVSSYGNPGIGSCGIGVVSEGIGVIGFGDKGDIDFGVVVVTFFIDFGRPHICDSVVLTKASFGLLGSHIFDFIAGEIVVLVGDGLVGVGEVGDGDDGAEGVWA
jgi:hypothetical protein